MNSKVKHLAKMNAYIYTSTNKCYSQKKDNYTVQSLSSVVMDVLGPRPY